MTDNNSGGDLSLNVVRGENEENGNNAHTSSDNSEKPNVIYRGKVRDNEKVITKDDNASNDSDDDDEFVESTETEQTACPHSSSAPVPLPPLFPLDDVPQRITPDLLLAALREEEPGVPDPDAIHKNCYDAMNALKEKGILNKYVLSGDEAAVLCAIPMLVQLKSGPFSMQKMVESCNAGTPSKLFVIMLTALRKLPRYKGIMHIESEVQSEEEFEAKKKRKDGIIQYPIYVATKYMSSASGTTNTASHREVLRVEEGWGYDISDFALERDESGRYFISYGGDIVIIEPWQGFKVVNSSIYRSQERISVVPVERVDGELVYCTEIVPNVSSHAIRIMKEGMDDVNVVRNMLKILTTHPFDTPYDSRTTFRKDGGIECLIDCYNKHNALGKEVIVCLRNVIGDDKSSARIFFDKGFIKTVANLTFENIDDPALCQSSSTIIKATCCSFTFVYNLDKLFQDIRGFKLILGLLLNHKTNAMICSNTLAILNSMFLYSGVMQIPEDTLKSLFDSGLFEILDSIMGVTRDETLMKTCDNVLSTIHTKRLDKIVGFDSNNYTKLLYRRNIITNSTINQFETNEARLEKLSKKLSVIDNETITEDDIKAALQGIEISDPEKILDKSKKVYDEYKDVLNESYILSEEEAIVIESYIYEDKENKNMSPYRIINKKLRDENNAQDQMDNTKSYLQLLLRALRKLPRTKPQILYRGIGDDKREYVKGGEIKWGGFSSTTKSINKAHKFVKSEETNKFSGTLFEVRNVWGYNIREFSHFDEGEVLLEPMMKFVVKDVKKEGSLTRVILEPKEDQSLLFMESIPPTCVQRIILNLKNLKSSTDPKEICRMCDILRKVPMDDDTSPDSRRMFREHGGTKLLCDLFKEHRKFSIARALAHVMDPRDVVSNIKFVKNISEDIYANPTEETIDIEASLVFLDFLGSLNAKNVQTSTTMKMIKGFSTLVNKFVDDKSFCLKILKLFNSNFTDSKDSYQIMLDRVIMTKKVIKTHLSDPEICKLGCSIITNMFIFLSNNEHREQEDEEDYIKVVAEVMKIHIDDAGVCMHACGALLNAVRENENNQNMAREVGCIGFVLDIISKHIDNVDVCIYGCGALLNMTEHNGGNQKEARRLNGIKIVLDATNKHYYDANSCVSGCGALSEMINNCTHFNQRHPFLLHKYNILDVIQDNQIRVDVIKTVLNSINLRISNGEICRYGCTILWNISRANSIAQMNACENGCVDVLLKVLEAHDNNKVVCERCCGALGVILSSQDLHSRYCTDDVRSIIEGCHEKHKDSTDVFQFLMGLMRGEDSKVRKAIERGACTKNAFPKCSDDCKSDESRYCPKCCIQQRAFRCRTCDKDKILLYCETCWRRDHQGHECEEFFYPVRCATKTRTN